MLNVTRSVPLVPELILPPLVFISFQPSARLIRQRRAYALSVTTCPATAVLFRCSARAQLPCPVPSRGPWSSHTAMEKRSAIHRRPPLRPAPRTRGCFFATRPAPTCTTLKELVSSFFQLFIVYFRMTGLSGSVTFSILNLCGANKFEVTCHGGPSMF